MPLYGVATAYIAAKAVERDQRGGAYTTAEGRISTAEALYKGRREHSEIIQFCEFSVNSQDGTKNQRKGSKKVGQGPEEHCQGGQEEEQA